MVIVLRSRLPYTAVGEEAITKAISNAHVYAMADKYDIPSLTALATSKFKSCMPDCTVASIAQVIDVVYSSTPMSRKDLRDILVHHCCTYMHVLRESQDFVEVLKTHSDFAAAVALEVSRMASTERNNSSSRLEGKDRKIQDLKDSVKNLKLELSEQAPTLIHLREDVSDARGSLYQAQRKNRMYLSQACGGCKAHFNTLT